jgi:hypothetical protein
MAQTDNQTNAMIVRDFADEVIPRETKARLASRSGSLSPA